MVSAVGQGLMVAAKAIQTGITVHQIVQSCTKEEKLTTDEKIEVAVECLFAALQLLDLGMSGVAMSPIGASKTFTQVHLGVNAAAGAADVTRLITSKFIKKTFGVEDFIDILAVICFRTAASMNGAQGVAAQDTRHLLCAIEQGFTLASAGCNLAAGGFRLYRKRDGLEAMGRALFTQLLTRYKKLPVVELPENMQDPNFFCNVVVRSMLNWETLEKIPSLYWQDPQLSLFTCKITQEPVRFAIKPIKGSAPGTIYERAEIDKWLETKPTEIPPGWPTGLEFKKENCCEHILVQYAIDKSLQQIAKELSEIHTSIAREERIKNTTLSNIIGELSDQEVTKKVIAHLPSQIEMQILVKKIGPFNFQNQALAARQITIRHKEDPNRNPVEIRSFLKALLPLDSEEIDLSFWNSLKFHIFISEEGNAYKITID